MLKVSGLQGDCECVSLLVDYDGWELFGLNCRFFKFGNGRYETNRGLIILWFAAQVCEEPKYIGQICCSGINGWGVRFNQSAVNVLVETIRTNKGAQ